MFAFYYIDKEYCDFLRTFDPKVPELNYDEYDKFFCGVVLDVNGIRYYAPISHDTHVQRTNLLIYDKGRAVSSIKFSFMVPVMQEKLLARLDFGEIAQKDPKYADLLRAEYRYCSTTQMQQKIVAKANSVYRIGCNKNHRLNINCCQFDVLEAHMNEYGSE